jgi:hypothetical protein
MYFKERKKNIRTIGMCWTSSRKCRIFFNVRINFCYGIYFNKFHAICKGKFQKCHHIYLAMHSHSALIFRLRCISICAKKNPTFTWRTSTHANCTLEFYNLLNIKNVFKHIKNVIIIVISFWFDFFGILTPLSAVFQLYRLRVECTLFLIYKAGLSLRSLLRFPYVHVYVRFTKLVLSLRVTTCDK